MFIASLVQYVNNTYIALHTQLSCTQSHFILKTPNEITRNNFLPIFKMRKLRFKKVKQVGQCCPAANIRTRPKNTWSKLLKLGFTRYSLRNCKILLLGSNTGHRRILHSSCTRSPITWIRDLDPPLSC